MAMLWSDIERDLASSQRHFTLAVEMFDEVHDAVPSREQYVRTMGFLHAMQSGYTSFEAGMKRLLGLLDEPLPMGPEWHKALLRRLEEPALGSRPALVEDPALRRALHGLLAFRHVAAHVYDEFDGDRAALAAQNARVFLAGIGPALASFRAIVDPD